MSAHPRPWPEQTARAFWNLAVEELAGEQSRCERTERDHAGAMLCRVRQQIRLDSPAEQVEIRLVNRDRYADCLRDLDGGEVLLARIARYTDVERLAVRDECRQRSDRL